MACFPARRSRLRLTCANTFTYTIHRAVRARQRSMRKELSGFGTAPNIATAAGRRGLDLRVNANCAFHQRLHIGQDLRLVRRATRRDHTRLRWVLLAFLRK